jgi:hypothetical protein
MKFKLYKQYGALNSQPIFSAFEQGVKNQGYSVVEQNEDISVIWSVLWQGRMQENKKIYRHCIKNNRPVIIIEVGNLKRGITWRVSVDNINRLGYFGNDKNFNVNRSKILGIELKEPKILRREEILIACQHNHSLQWEGMPAMADWVKTIILDLKKYTDRPIIVRPHPRSMFNITDSRIKIEKPQKVPNSYDDFDIDYGYHCVINHNSGPCVQAAISGTPVVCDPSSLAYPVSDKLANIEDIELFDRDDWFLKLCHTEWTVDEIAAGIPLSRIESYLLSRLNR